LIAIWNATAVVKCIRNFITIKVQGTVTSVPNLVAVIIGLVRIEKSGTRVEIVKDTISVDIANFNGANVAEEWFYVGRTSRPAYPALVSPSADISV